MRPAEEQIAIRTFQQRSVEAMERIASAQERIAVSTGLAAAGLARIAAVFEGPQPDPKPVQPEVPAVHVADD